MDDLQDVDNPFDDAFEAAQHRAAVFDLDDWTVLRIRGNDARKFLNNFCTNDLKTLDAGFGFEIFLTNVKARVVGHGLLYHDAVGDSFRLVTSPGQANALMTHLDRYVITEDVVISDETHSHGLLALTGPAAADVLREIGLEFELPAARHRFVTTVCPWQDFSIEISSFDGLQWPAYFLAARLDEIQRVVQGLEAVGVIAGELDVFNSLRVEAVYPLGGVDVTEDHLAPEVDRPWAISYTKGCYLGQEPIARIDAMGHVNRMLRGVRLLEEVIPEFGAEILDGDKVVGELRSFATSGLDGQVIGLAIIKRSHAAQGQKVAVRIGEATYPATVFDLPIRS